MNVWLIIFITFLSNSIIIACVLYPILWKIAKDKERIRNQIKS